jgi:ribosomal protein L32
MTTTLKTWIKLKEGLESLVDSGTIEEAIEKLEFYTTANVNLMENWEHDNTISEICIGGHDNYKCLCGKQHLKLLHIFNVEGREDKYIIGSSCIDHIRRLREEYEDNLELLEKIGDISICCIKGEYDQKHKACLRCGEMKIRKGYEYKKPFKKDFCGDCITNEGYFRCMDCKYGRFGVEKDYQGNYKTLCKRCWYIRRIKKPTTTN